ncbi:MAG TPA: calcium/proton exchanger [Candidatus Limnocylindrales bacterium]|nr:calcium/proton exchanger [Candidatus Limnocylindrales bacterium]
MPQIGRRTLLIFGGYAVAFALVALTNLLGLPPLVRFAAAVIALAGGAVAVGEATERLSLRMSPAATGVVQSVLGNLPELFLAIFALQAGLHEVVAAALVGSVLGNSLFVLGLATLIGGLRHGNLKFSAAANRLYATELVLGVAALTVPFLATQPGAPDFGHAEELSAFVAIVLLVLFAASVPISIKLSGDAPATKPHIPSDDDPATPDAIPPLLPTLVLLAVSAVSAAFVADWFVEALEPAMGAIGMSEAFAGLIVVAIAGNAVENLAGVSSAAKGKGDLAMSLILNSALQIVLFLTPVIVLLSFFVAPVPLTLIISPLLLGTLAVSVLLVVFIVTDGEANAFEGAMLLGLYAIVAAAVWFGPRIAT